MNQRRETGGWLQSLGIIAGLYAGFRYGHTVGTALLPARFDGFLAFCIGFLVTVAVIVTTFNALDARHRDENGGGTSPLALWLRGLGWRMAARLVLAVVILGPPAALYWAWRGGWLANFLTGVN